MAPGAARPATFSAGARQLLFEQHQAGASGGQIVAQWTAVVDQVVQALYTAARASYAERYAVLDQRFAMIAQGGYGRAELNPCSDIDLLFLYPQRAPTRSSRPSPRRCSTPCGTPG